MNYTEMAQEARSRPPYPTNMGNWHRTWASFMGWHKPDTSKLPPGSIWLTEG